jgi:carbon-monoxide dehydrogenase small subunit
MVGRKIVTVEGLAERGRLHPLQVAFAELGAAQCGYCTPGILVTAKALLDHNLSPTRQEIREALAGNLCRCTGYTKILDSVELAARRMRDASPDLHPPAPGPRVGALVEVEDPAPQPGAAALGMPR